MRELDHFLQINPIHTLNILTTPLEYAHLFHFRPYENSEAFLRKRVKKGNIILSTINSKFLPLSDIVSSLSKIKPTTHLSIIVSTLRCFHAIVNSTRDTDFLHVPAFRWSTVHTYFKPSDLAQCLTECYVSYVQHIPRWQLFAMAINAVCDHISTRQRSEKIREERHKIQSFVQDYLLFIPHHAYLQPGAFVPNAGVFSCMIIVALLIIGKNPSECTSIVNAGTALAAKQASWDGKQVCHRIDRARRDLMDEVRQSPLILSCLRDSNRKKVAEALIKLLDKVIIHGNFDEHDSLEAACLISWLSHGCEPKDHMHAFMNILEHCNSGSYDSSTMLTVLLKTAATTSSPYIIRRCLTVALVPSVVANVLSENKQSGIHMKKTSSIQRRDDDDPSSTPAQTGGFPGSSVSFISNPVSNGTQFQSFPFHPPQLGLPATFSSSHSSSSLLLLNLIALSAYQGVLLLEPSDNHFLIRTLGSLFSTCGHSSAVYVLRHVLVTLLGVRERKREYDKIAKKRSQLQSEWEKKEKEANERKIREQMAKRKRENDRRRISEEQQRQMQDGERLFIPTQQYVTPFSPNPSILPGIATIDGSIPYGAIPPSVAQSPFSIAMGMQLNQSLSYPLLQPVSEPVVIGGQYQTSGVSESTSPIPSTSIGITSSHIVNLHGMSVPMTQVADIGGFTVHDSLPPPPQRSTQSSISSSGRSTQSSISSSGVGQIPLVQYQLSSTPQTQSQAYPMRSPPPQMDMSSQSRPNPKRSGIHSHSHPQGQPASSHPHQRQAHTAHLPPRSSSQQHPVSHHHSPSTHVPMPTLPELPAELFLDMYLRIMFQAPTSIDNPLRTMLQAYVLQPLSLALSDLYSKWITWEDRPPDMNGEHSAVLQTTSNICPVCNDLPVPDVGSCKCGKCSVCPSCGYQFVRCVSGIAQPYGLNFYKGEIEERSVEAKEREELIEKIKRVKEGGKQSVSDDAIPTTFTVPQSMHSHKESMNMLEGCYDEESMTASHQTPAKQRLYSSNGSFGRDSGVETHGYYSQHDREKERMGGVSGTGDELCMPPGPSSQPLVSMFSLGYLPFSSPRLCLLNTIHHCIFLTACLCDGAIDVNHILGVTLSTITRTRSVAAMRLIRRCMDVRCAEGLLRALRSVCAARRGVISMFFGSSKSSSLIPERPDQTNSDRSALGICGLIGDGSVHIGSDVIQEYNTHVDPLLHFLSFTCLVLSNKCHDVREERTKKLGRFALANTPTDFHYPHLSEMIVQEIAHYVKCNKCHDVREERTKKLGRFALANTPTDFHYPHLSEMIVQEIAHYVKWFHLFTNGKHLLEEYESIKRFLGLSGQAVAAIPVLIRSTAALSLDAVLGLLCFSHFVPKSHVCRDFECARLSFSSFGHLAAKWGGGINSDVDTYVTSQFMPLFVSVMKVLDREREKEVLKALSQDQCGAGSLGKKSTITQDLGSHKDEEIESPGITPENRATSLLNRGFSITVQSHKVLSIQSFSSRPPISSSPPSSFLRGLHFSLSSYCSWHVQNNTIQIIPIHLLSMLKEEILPRLMVHMYELVCECICGSNPSLPADVRVLSRAISGVYELLLSRDLVKASDLIEFIFKMLLIIGKHIRFMISAAARMPLYVCSESLFDTLFTPLPLTRGGQRQVRTVSVWKEVFKLNPYDQETLAILLLDTLPPSVLLCPSVVTHFILPLCERRKKRDKQFASERVRKQDLKDAIKEETVGKRRTSHHLSFSGHTSQPSKEFDGNSVGKDGKILRFGSTDTSSIMGSLAHSCVSSGSTRSVGSTYEKNERPEDPQQTVPVSSLSLPLHHAHTHTQLLSSATTPLFPPFRILINCLEELLCSHHFAHSRDLSALSTIFSYYAHTQLMEQVLTPHISADPKKRLHSSVHNSIRRAFAALQTVITSLLFVR
ncbi:hypothetical protein ADUPG1_010379, partial [Aduncisulcus paluster]